MQGFEKIKAQILADAEQEKDKILAEAKAQADAITRQYSLKADEAAHAARQKGEAELAAAKARAEFASEGSVNMAVLQKKQQLISDAFVKAQQNILGLPADDMLLVLLDIGKGLGQQSGEIIMNAADSKKLGKQLSLQLSKATGGKFTLSKQTAPISGGFVLKSGDIEINCSFDSLIERAKQELSCDVAEILFVR